MQGINGDWGQLGGVGLWVLVDVLRRCFVMNLFAFTEITNEYAFE